MTESTPPDGAASDATDPELSVIVPVYDEEDRIGTCLESVLAACRAAGPFEVIVVDSNSTDRTVEIATEYPVTVVRIPDDDLTTPGAGRYVGTELASADRLLYVDGDMRLAEGWLPEALDLLESAEDVAGVDGHLNDADGADGVERVDTLNGVVLYDRDALASVGGFDPFMDSLEDVDVGFRLTADGHRLLRTPSVAGYHPTTEGVSELRRRWRNGYFWGIGQAVRKSLDRPRVLAKHLWRFRFKLAVMGWLVLGGVGLAFVPVGVAWLAATLAVYLLGVKRQGASRATQRAIGYCLVVAGFVRGALMDKPRPESFPMGRVETVADGPTLTPADAQRP